MIHERIVEIAEVLGYTYIWWDPDHDCFVGTRTPVDIPRDLGSPFGVSREEMFFIAWDERGVDQLLHQAGRGDLIALPKLPEYLVVAIYEADLQPFTSTYAAEGPREAVLMAQAEAGGHGNHLVIAAVFVYRDGQSLDPTPLDWHD